MKLARPICLSFSQNIQWGHSVPAITGPNCLYAPHAQRSRVIYTDSPPSWHTPHAVALETLHYPTANLCFQRNSSVSCLTSVTTTSRKPSWLDCNTHPRMITLLALSHIVQHFLIRCLTVLWCLMSVTGSSSWRVTKAVFVGCQTLFSTLYRQHPV